MTAWEEVESEFECDHPDSEIRYRLDSLGRKLFVEQCLCCGEAVGAPIKYSDVENKDLIMPFDQGLADQRETQKHARWTDLTAEQNRLHHEHKSDWWQKYSAYLETPAWQDKRARVLQRDGHVCQACLKRRATQAHHLTYAHVGHEPLFELVAICDVCHAELHKDDGNGRHVEISHVLSR